MQITGCTGLASLTTNWQSADKTDCWPRYRGCLYRSLTAQLEYLFVELLNTTSHPNVRFWHKADMQLGFNDVRFWG